MTVGLNLPDSDLVHGNNCNPAIQKYVVQFIVCAEDAQVFSSYELEVETLVPVSIYRVYVLYKVRSLCVVCCFLSCHDVVCFIIVP